MMFPHRGFMLSEVYYRVMLKKYNDNKARQGANTQDGQNAMNFLDNLTDHTSLDSMFFNNEEDDKAQVTKNNKVNESEIEQHNSTTEMETRKVLNEISEIVEESLYNATLTVATNYYRFPIKSKNKKLVEYKPTDNMVDANENRAINFWFKTQDYNIDYNYTLFHNYDNTDNVGYLVNLNNGYLNLQYNQNTYSLPIGQQMQNNVWYNILVNYDQIKRKCELAVYKRQSENGQFLNDSKLILVQKQKFDIVPENMQHSEEIYIGGVDTGSYLGNQNNWYMTNIRLYNEVIPTKNRNIVLNEKITQDTNLLIFSDNAENYLDLPNYGNI